MEKFIDDLKNGVDMLADIEINADSNLNTLSDWDSLAILSTIATISSEYGVVLRDTDISNAKSIQELYDLVQSKI